MFPVQVRSSVDVQLPFHAGTVSADPLKKAIVVVRRDAEIPGNDVAELLFRKKVGEKWV